MDRRADEIARRQRELLRRSSALRSRLAEQADVLRGPLSLADQARDGWHWLRAHPEWPVGVAVVLVVARPRRSLRWALRLWTAWRFWRRLQDRVLASPA